MSQRADTPPRWRRVHQSAEEILNVRAGLATEEEDATSP